MRQPRSPLVLLVLLVLLVPLASCARANPSPIDHAGHGAMGPEITVPPGARYTEADVRFMQGMIAHHAQAIAMTNLAESRAEGSRLLTLARKIDQSQAAEIRQMQGWLRDHGQFAPDTSSHRTMTMPGMLTPAQLARLATLRGRDFDRLFLELMIRHHEGALTMVADLFAAPRAGQEVDVNTFANEVQLVQSIEIEIMREMLAELQGAQVRWQ